MLLRRTARLVQRTSAILILLPIPQLNENSRLPRAQRKWPTQELSGNGLFVPASSIAQVYVYYYVRQRATAGLARLSATCTVQHLVWRRKAQDFILALPAILASTCNNLDPCLSLQAMFNQSQSRVYPTAEKIVPGTLSIGAGEGEGEGGMGWDEGRGARLFVVCSSDVRRRWWTWM